MRVRAIASRARAPRGFTLLEILVVLAIIGLLAGLAIVNVGRTHDNAAEVTARLFVNESLKVPLTQYKFSVGDFPSTAEGLQALRAAPSDRAARWRGPSLEKPALDPWGEPYRYAYPGKHNKDGYDAWSTGRDKIDGTADDIGNWETVSGPSR